MSSPRAVFALALGDFRERSRRYSFLVTLLLASYLGYLAATGKVSLRLGEYRGLYTSAWVGAMMSLITTSFLSLIGFYIVKNAVQCDRQTGVGEILASAPLSRTFYVVGKFISNLALLASIVGVIALSAVAMQLLAAEDRVIHLWALLSPFLLLSLPAMALTAALAILFETVQWLRGGFGNVAWFFLWALGLSLPRTSGIPQCDPFGLQTVFHSIMPAARASIPGYEGGFSLTFANTPIQVFRGFHWDGITWTSAEFSLRIIWFALALALVLLSAAFFDRFDPARSQSPWPSKQEVAAKVAAEILSPSYTAETATGARIHLTPLTHALHGSPCGRIFIAELRLAVKGLRWWWYAVAAGLIVAQCFAPLNVSRGLLTAAWIWPILIWSTAGTREVRFGTQQLLFSCPGILGRQLPAAWLAGVTITFLLGAGVALRLAMSGQATALLAWTAGALFVPSLALASGVWTGTSRFFEGLYTALWYVGPLNRVPGLDFTGAASGARTARFAWMYLVIAAGLLAAAFARRARQLRGI